MAAKPPSGARSVPILPIVIGTAGHIDHGKSSLVRALTGVDPDRLKEEKERGMTIDLGFAPLELPDGRLVGIVDVPGHERFVRNMVAGATGIDLVVLVVAADDGVMPQTREHLHIMELLGVRQGLVALTKVDAVEPDLVELAAEDVRACVRGTFLEGAPLLPLSSVTGEGVEALRDALVEIAGGIEPRPAEGVFRMPVQRVFSKPGFGAVLTGIPVSGVARVGDVLEVLPGGARGKVRGLNAYRRATDVVRAGHSSALNLADVDHHAVERGFVVATPGFFGPERMLAARLTSLADLPRPIPNRMRIRLHTGTADPAGELVLLDVEELGSGETALVQIRLSEPVVCAPGDRFVLRRLSPVETLGGGTILEESRHRLKRFKGFVLEGLARREDSLASPDALLATSLERRATGWASTDELAVECKLAPAEVAERLTALAATGEVVSPRDGRWMHARSLSAARERLAEVVAAWFEEHPHRETVDVLELRKRLRIEPQLLGALLDAARDAGEVELRSGGKVRPSGRSAVRDEALEAVCTGVLERLEAGAFQPPALDRLGEDLGVAPETIARAIESLTDTGSVAHIGGELYLSSSHLDRARAEVVANCGRHGHLEIPELRDRLATSRKFLIPLLEHFDAQGLTIRQGAHRVLRQR